MTTTTLRRRWIKNRRDLLVFVVIFALVSLVVAGVAFLLWTANPAQPGAVALAALGSSESVAVTQSDGVITFDPLTPDQRPVGFIFYPGALVDPRAYAPVLRPLAEAGFLVVTRTMPLNLAIFDTSAADALRAAHPEIAAWVIGGHSMGGAMASRYTLDRGDLAGLALLASFPFGDLSGLTLPTVSIYGDSDGLISLRQIDESRAVLPVGTEYMLLEGANHAQFGDYGAQRGDLPAALPAADQQAATAAALLALLEQVESNGISEQG
ncbi:MAG: alpha/beta hydrolase [Anaerolineae bacterium]|nr:alpha/beta hydrolase [Anaerolineae bacterium]NUQ06227.1 alpha/beta hydrolase [Anaerolineae bacterium]